MADKRVRCSRVRKAMCAAPCFWTIGKGCSRSVNARKKASALSSAEISQLKTWVSQGLDKLYIVDRDQELVLREYFLGPEYDPLRGDDEYIPMNTPMKRDMGRVVAKYLKTRVSGAILKERSMAKLEAHVLKTLQGYNPSIERSWKKYWKTETSTRAIAHKDNLLKLYLALMKQCDDYNDFVLELSKNEMLMKHMKRTAKGFTKTYASPDMAKYIQGATRKTRLKTMPLKHNSAEWDDVVLVSDDKDALSYMNVMKSQSHKLRGALRKSLGL